MFVIRSKIRNVLEKESSLSIPETNNETQNSQKLDPPNSSVLYSATSEEATVQPFVPAECNDSHSQFPPIDVDLNKSKDSSELVSVETKWKIRCGLEKLETKELRKAVDIIRKLEPEHCNSGPNEFEVDFDILKPSTLKELETFINHALNI